MNYLVFCSAEIGGLPFRIAEILNFHGIRTYYISLAEVSAMHDSTKFHFGERVEQWDLSEEFSDISSSPKKIVEKLVQIKQNYGISGCLATGEKAYMLKRAYIDYKYWSYGSDLDQFSFEPLWPPGYPLWKKFRIIPLFTLTIRRRYRNSFRLADSVMIAPYQKAKLDVICPGKKMFFLPHFLKIDKLESLEKKKKESKDKISKEIGARHFFFSSTRQIWTDHYKRLEDNKRNDIILRAFATYLNLSIERNTKLVLIKKGPDVESSRRLTDELGIGDYVVWIDERPRCDLDEYYRGADFCFGQFGTPVITGAVVEPLSQANICISFIGEKKAEVPYYRNLPPVYNSRDPDEIARFMIRLMKDGSYHINLCRESWSWAKKNCSEEIFAKAFLELFKDQNAPGRI